jgi:hypothetical protein
MINSRTAPESSKSLHINVQPSNKNVHTTDRKALLLDILKTLEASLQQRGHLKFYKELGIHPLWFIAENERNIYLWRHGYSLSDLSKFEFWVDIENIAIKRIRQLKLTQDGFTQLSPAWGLGLPSEHDIQAEIDYLNSFLDITAKIEKHIYALSKAGFLLLNELNPINEENTKVLLPSGIC